MLRNTLGRVQSFVAQARPLWSLYPSMNSVVGHKLPSLGFSSSSTSNTASPTVVETRPYHGPADLGSSTWSVKETFASTTSSDDSTTVTAADIGRLAKLSYLSVATDAGLEKDVATMATWLGRVKNLSVDEYEPMYSPLIHPGLTLHAEEIATAAGLENTSDLLSVRRREDQVTEGGEDAAPEHDLAMAGKIIRNSQNTDRGYFVVPAVMDEEE